MTEKTTKTDRQRALLALIRHNGNMTKAAREADVPRHKIARWRDEANALTLDDLERTLMTHAALLAEDLLNGLIVEAPLNQRASALGMLVDRLLKLESRHESQPEDIPTDTPSDDGRVRMVFRDKQGRLREWGDWENWDTEETDATGT